MKTQTSSAAFSASGLEVARATRVVLGKQPRYQSTVEVVPGTLFTTQIQPTKGLISLLFLATEMSIRIAQEGEGSRLSTEIVPPDGIAADIFGFYRRYMKDFLEAVRSEVSG